MQSANSQYYDIYKTKLESIVNKFKQLYNTKDINIIISDLEKLTNEINNEEENYNLDQQNKILPLVELEMKSKAFIEFLGLFNLDTDELSETDMNRVLDILNYRLELIPGNWNLPVYKFQIGNEKFYIVKNPFSYTINVVYVFSGQRSINGKLVTMEPANGNFGLGSNYYQVFSCNSCYKYFGNVKLKSLRFERN